MSNKMNFIANPMLIGAMELVKKNKSPENLRVFMDELLHARLLSPIIITPPPALDENGMAKITAESKISIPMIPGPEDKKYLIAFTDPIELKKMKVDASLNVLPFGIKDYAAMIAKTEDKCDGLVINPGSRGPIVNKAMIAAIMGKVVKKPEEDTAAEQAEAKTEN